MATKERKLSLSRKQPPAIPKEIVPAEKSLTPTETSPKTPTTSPNKPSIGKKIARKPSPRKLLNTPKLQVKLKAKAKNALKFNTKISKTLLQGKPNEVKKKLLKNGVNEVKPRRRRRNPVAMLLAENEGKTPPKKRIRVRPESKVKDELEEERISAEIDRTIHDVINEICYPKNEVQKKRVRTLKKPKVEPTESIDEVINDLNFLLKGEDIKPESDSMSESSRSDSNKSRKNTKKPPEQQLRRKLLKKENIENTLEKLDLDDHKIIDMLDLNVEFKREIPLEKRRHSIEKIPIGLEADGTLQQLTVFNHLPRSISPRLRKARGRTLEGVRSRPYTTRSDSPARLLRNGKHRKLKDSNLVGGLEGEYKRRKRLCSDLSGSELSVSKLSGYESEGSYSDMSSNLLETNDQKDGEPIKTPPKDFVPLTIKKSLSTEASTMDCTNNIDTNSNVCEPLDIINEQKADLTIIKQETPSEKVPEKSKLLHIMKQAFNSEKETTPPPNLEAQPQQEHSSSTQIIETPIILESTPIQLDPSPPPIDSEDKETNPPILIVVPPHNEEKVPSSSSSDTESSKEDILQALGLQSLKAAEEAAAAAKHRPRERSLISALASYPRNDCYTGTLKTVIKLNRDNKKKGRNPLKMTLQKSKGGEGDTTTATEEGGYKIMKEGGSSSSNWKQSNPSSDTADGSSEHTSDGETGPPDEAKLLVIPEKASSFSIHPGRLCKDECSYCFGKFGLFDTPCHIAQIKTVERQDKILAVEKHLTRDSCLCDACYRHVDRKTNTPSYTSRSLKRNSLVAPGPRQNHCHVMGCNMISSNILRRKWIIKMRRSVCQVINIDLDNPGLHSIPICEQHYAALEHLMVCAMCKRRLARNHVHYIGQEGIELNGALEKEGIPLVLTDKSVVCKLCRCFSTVILKSPEERSENSLSFFSEYKKRLLHFNGIVPMEETAAEEPISAPTKEKPAPPTTDNKDKEVAVRKRRKLSKNNTSVESILSNNTTEIVVQSKSPERSKTPEPNDQTNVPLPDDQNHTSRSESPTDYSIDYTTLIPAIAMDCESDSDSRKESLVKNNVQRLDAVKEAVEISKTIKLNDHSEFAVQRLGSNPSISVRQLFPGEEEMGLQANIEFNVVKEKTPEGWEKCNSVIQYDMETKKLWHELQKPYGNQSSFLRHLILLEKYYRNGDLVLSANASSHSQNYSVSVNNRLRAFDNIPSGKPPNNKAFGVNSVTIQKAIEQALPPSSSQIQQQSLNRSTPITLSHLMSPPLIPTTILHTNSLLKPTKPAASSPPGLVSFQSSSRLAQAPTNLVKKPPTQKIKFPITKNWRPTLIPIEPGKKQDRKPGLVQVISGGKPYHITLDDYKKMCAIKRSFEQKQQRQETPPSTTPKSVFVPQKILPRKSILLSSKTMPSNLPLTTTTQPVELLQETTESILEKLDRQVEKLQDKPSMPKIPKSLTVIPQTVTRKFSTSPTTSSVLTPQTTNTITKHKS